MIDALDDKLAHGCAGFRLLGCGLAIGEGGWAVKLGALMLVSIPDGWANVEGGRPGVAPREVWFARREDSRDGFRVVTREWTGRTRTHFIEVTTASRTAVAT